MITVTGNGTIQTWTPPSKYSTTYGGCVDIFVPAGSTWQFTTGGNILNPPAFTAPNTLHGCNNGTDWYFFNPSNTVTTITTGAAPAITAANGLQTITLSANATPTITGIAAGQRITFQICQPASGGPYTWTWPSAVHGGMTIGTTASDCNIQSFDSFSGTTLVPESAGTTNVAP